ncbi:NepR family anti-sigma factor [Microvirga calopogonii]|uniref:NepR family anti-sigma factor n=1 Tax=Microvirga calopogonii TaxID=2078013 RepID=UPI00147972DA|nr:NepR family anti-sigma factor [Microvirga calopogonii]
MVSNSLKVETLSDEPDGFATEQRADGVPAAEPNLPPHIATCLGEQLQAFYAHLMNEPVPDRFLQLLANLDRIGNKTDGE